jgi:hypothetical protein
MRPDSLERLINGADVGDFRALALSYLPLAGFRHVELTDGPGDQGNDIAVWQQGNNPEHLAIQLSVQKRWKSKLRGDAVRAKERFDTSNFIYITSRRISSQDKEAVTTDLWSNYGISLRVIDSQAIASKFIVEGKTGEILQTLGIASQESAYGGRGKPVNLREDLAYAYAFFGTDVDSFRQSAIARSIAAFIAQDHEVPPSRSEVVESLRSALKLSKARDSLISGQIDRMLQLGEIRVKDEGLVVSETIEESNRTLRVLRGRQWRELQDRLSACLGNAGLTGRKLERLTEDTSEAAGALMLNSAITARAALEPGGDMGPAKRQIEAALKRLERKLIDAGIAPTEANVVLTDLTKEISESEIGQTLMAGHLFLSILDMSVSDLLQGLGGRESLELFLDASVAIPMLAGLLYEPHDIDFFRAASRAYEQSRHYGVDLKLPRDYLEEAASHLLEAYARYRPLLDADEDLRFSQNAFVAHYSALRRASKYDGSFAKYASIFGLREGANSSSFRTERNWIMDRMRSQFARYGITVVDAKQISREALFNAEKAISFTARELNIERSSRLFEHDARAIAEITSRAAVGSAAVMFCTKDRLHLQLSTAEGAVDWHAVDPSMLSDLLALASTEADFQTGVAVEVAMSLGEAEARRGAQIWDELVKIEKENFYDADALQRAKEFKDGYIASLQAEADVEPVETAWEKWQETAA